MTDEVVQRLDRLIGLVELGMRDQLRAAREAIGSDPAYAAILAGATKEVPAGKLSTAVQKKTQQSPRSVARRIAELVEMGALERLGSGGTVSYVTTGLI